MTRTIGTMRLLSLALGVATMIGVTGAAVAQTERSSQHVKTSDLDLSTEAGQHALNDRIAAAARRACWLEEIRTGMNIRPTETAACRLLAREATGERVAEAIAGTRRSGQPAQVRLDRRTDLP